MAGPQNWRVRLDHVLVLGSRLSIIRPAALPARDISVTRHWSVLHRQPFMTEVTVTLPSQSLQTLLSRSPSRGMPDKD